MNIFTKMNNELKMFQFSFKKFMINDFLINAVVDNTCFYPPLNKKKIILNKTYANKKGNSKFFK